MAEPRSVSTELMRAIAKQCECEFSETGELLRVCPSHKAVAEDQSFVNHMEFAHALREKWKAQERKR